MDTAGSMPRHHLGRDRTVGSNPLKSSPSCAALISTDVPVSTVGHRNPPRSSRFVQHQNPEPSKKIRRSRWRRRFVNTNTLPSSGSPPICSFTIPYSPSSPFLRSTASTPNHTRRGRPKLNTAGAACSPPRPAPTAQPEESSRSQTPLRRSTGGQAPRP
jgi:hypothetical protein